MLMQAAQTSVLAILCRHQQDRHAIRTDQKERYRDALCDINVKEVKVQPGLHESSYDSYGIYHVFGKVSAERNTHGVQHPFHVFALDKPIYPVGNIQCPVDS